MYVQREDSAVEAAKHEGLGEGPGLLAVRVLDLAGLSTTVNEMQSPASPVVL